MDIKAFTDAAVAGVPLLFVVLGLVQYLKRFKNKDGSQKIDGNWLLIASMFTGLVAGGLYMIAQSRPPAGDWWQVYVYWFGVIVYGVGLGLVASGIYDLTKGVVERALRSKGG